MPDGMLACLLLFRCRFAFSLSFFFFSFLSLVFFSLLASAPRAFGLFGSVWLFITSRWIITGEMEGHFALIGWSLVRLKDLIGWPSKQRFLAF